MSKDGPTPPWLHRHTQIRRVDQLPLFLERHGIPREGARGFGVFARVVELECGNPEECRMPLQLLEGDAMFDT
jgi:hypothetical protein